ncbi:protein kinase domain-containing protein [Schlesneria paludicola]|uniref:protein kinase domain-containing protein n=1 Tax=Schlesneria paludicola TaxID=360056 RepID=UPI0012F8FDFF|nr:protein kinase [Schlesneria paludicola]
MAKTTRKLPPYGLWSIGQALSPTAADEGADVCYSVGDQDDVVLLIRGNQSVMSEPPSSDVPTSNVESASEARGSVDKAAGGTAEICNTMLGEFRLLRKLGTGGMAEVYLAEQTTLRRQVAVKILRPEFVKDEMYVKRFRHEAAAAGSLNHPNIVQVYMVGEQDGINYIAQEYVQGRTLKEYLKRKGPIEFRIALHILRQVASALQTAGVSGIVHRDIKPENILLNNKGEVKVADFGLAQLTLQGERISLTQTGMTMGTPLYMSPEQVNGQPLDARSDIYSFGIMAWHMLAGRPPFLGETAMSVAIKHLNEKPPKIADFRNDIPPVLSDFIRRLIQKKKEDRPADFEVVLAEIKAMLRQFSAKDDATAVFQSVPSLPGTGRLVDRPLRRQLIWLLACSLLVMMVSAGVGWIMRAPDLKSIVSKGRELDPLNPPEAQLYFAETNPLNETAWILLKEHKDASDEMKARAQTALALIYLNTNRRALAESTFRAMEIDPKFKADGLAGLAILAQIKGEADTAKKRMAQVDTMKATLFPEIEGAYADLQKRLNATK